MEDEWFDSDGTCYQAHPIIKDFGCEEGEEDHSAVVQIRMWGDEGCTTFDLCQIHYDWFKAEREFTRKSGPADDYVNLGAAL